MLQEKNISKNIWRNTTVFTGILRYLNDGWVIWQASLQRGLRFGRVAHADVLDVAAAEYDVLVDLVSRGHRAIRGTILGAEWANCKARYRFRADI